MAAFAAASRALLAGNFAIGCGLMVVPGALNDLVHSLRVSVPTGGQLVTVAAITMAFAAPLLAAALGGWDRRRLLTLALLWYALGHALSAAMPSFAALVPMRAITMLGAAVFTPQAAAAMNVMAPPTERGRAITFIFLGWALASVLGTPLHSYVGETMGWRWAFGLVALISSLAAVQVWRTVPDGIRPTPMNLASWRATLTHPLLMGVVAVTALNAAGQFTVFTFFAPYFRETLDAQPGAISLLFLCFGAFALLGNMALTRYINRLGAATCVTLAMSLMAFSLMVWPLAGGLLTMALVLVPWGLGVFSANSAQQARLGAAAPAAASALMALNTSAIYVGQAIGAAGGGVLLASSGYRWLPGAGLVWMLLAVGLSAMLARAMQGSVRVA